MFPFQKRSDSGIYEDEEVINFYKIYKSGIATLPEFVDDRLQFMN